MSQASLKSSSSSMISVVKEEQLAWLSAQENATSPQQAPPIPKLKLQKSGSKVDAMRRGSSNLDVGRLHSARPFGSVRMEAINLRDLSETAEEVDNEYAVVRQQGLAHGYNLYAQGLSLIHI